MLHQSVTIVVITKQAFFHLFYSPIHYIHSLQMNDNNNNDHRAFAIIFICHHYHHHRHHQRTKRRSNTKAMVKMNDKSAATQ